MIQSRGLDAEAPTATAVVYASVTLAATLLLMAAPRPLGPVPTPLLPVMTIYFWTIVRPSLMPAPAVFLAGLVLDLLTAVPLGFWPLSFLAASGAARILRPYMLGAVIWRRLAGVAGAVTAAALAGLIALGAADRPIAPTWLQLLQLFLTVLTYPIIEAAFSALSRNAGMGRGRS